MIIFLNSQTIKNNFMKHTNYVKKKHCTYFCLFLYVKTLQKKKSYAKWSIPKIKHRHTKSSVCTWYFDDLHFFGNTLHKIYIFKTKVFYKC